MYSIALEAYPAPIKWTPAFFPGGKGLWRDVDHSSPSIAGLGISGAVPLLPLYILEESKGTNLPLRLLVGFERGVGPDCQDLSVTDVVRVL